MCKYFYLKKKVVTIVLFIILNILSFDVIFANSISGIDRIKKVLITTKIFDNFDNLYEPVTRIDFAKMIVKASKQKDIPNDIALSYKKVALENGYMISFLGGDFKDQELTSYNDLVRACLALLSYNDKDFVGNKVLARKSKFENLKLDDGIDKEHIASIKKIDIANAIYNTLKSNQKDSDKMYGLTIFDKLYVDENGELNVTNFMQTKMEGPYFADRNKELNIPFIPKYIYINGLLANMNDLVTDIDEYGFLVYYYDKEKKEVSAFSERDDVNASIAVKRGYVAEINYNVENMLAPTSIDVDIARYDIVNEDMKIMFSYAGNIKKDDKIIFVYNKYNDIVKKDRDEEGRLTKGSIIYAKKCN